MNFLSSNPSPLFSCKEEELDSLVWEEKDAKIRKKLNYYLVNMSKEEEYLFLYWLQERKLWCEKCNNQFYSNEGFVNHGCMK